MGTTPTYGLRYQELGDLPNGAALGADLATDVEAELERIDADAATDAGNLADVDARLTTAEARIAPVRIASGQVTGVNYDGTSDAQVVVTFPAGRFTVAPRVTCTITNGNPSGSSGYAACWAGGVTPTNMTLRFRKNNADPSMAAYWIAVQDDEEV